MRIALIALIILMSLPSARAEGFARIYVYAQLQTAARSWRTISCDSAVVAKLKRGTFFAVNVAPGRHVLGIGGKGISVFVDVRPGEESFVRLDWQIEGDAPAIPLLQVVQPAQARTEMINLTYIDADKVLSRSAPKADPREPPRLKRRAQ